MKEHQHRILLVISTLWLVLMPWLRAQFTATAILCPIATVLPRYLPEIAFGSAFLFLVPAIWRRQPWVGKVLVASAIGLPILAFGIGRTWLWVLSSILLLFLAYSARTAQPSAAFEARRGYTRALMVVIHGPMVIVTPGAYLQLTAGAIAVVDGFREKHALLAILLLCFSLLGLHALWSVWSVSTRLWRYGAYALTHAEQRRRDLLGLVTAWTAMLGFAAIAKPIFRIPEVVMLSVAFGPALVLTSLFVLGSRAHPSEEPERSQRSVGTKSGAIGAFLGTVCGVAVASLGISYFIPQSGSGWGPCPWWWTLFPMEGSLWPTERPIAFDGCETHLPYQTIMFGVASVIFWISGATTAVGKASRQLAALAAAIPATTALVWVTLPHLSLPPGHTDEWLSTILVGVAVVLWAARLGYLGGAWGERFARPKQPQLADAIPSP
jgi:hypothetical protein